MKPEKTCPQCGTSLSVEGAASLCPKCVAKMILGSTVQYFGDYELLEEIGRGGMGVVYKARQSTLNRPVALKMLIQGGFASPEFVRRFQTEAEAAASLQHPNIVAIYEVGLIDGLHYFSMDYIDGPSLAEVAREGPLPPERAARYVQLIAEAVHHAHQRGILHRDLKPSNVLIDPFDQPRITDFGLAKRLDDDLGPTLTGQVLGSPGYMPPEQAAGRHSLIGVPSDVYALGAILYHLLTGHPPFTGETAAGVLVRVQKEEPKPPHALNPGLPRDLETVCLKCLHKDPSHRYSSTAELADELKRWQNGEAIIARPQRAAGNLRSWCIEHPRLAFSVGLTSLALLLSLAAVLWQPRGQLTAHNAQVGTNESPVSEPSWLTNSLGMQNQPVPATPLATDTSGNPPAQQTNQPQAVALDSSWMTRNLVAYFPFENDVRDASGCGNHGTNLGVTFTKGIRGSAGHFNGRDQFIRVSRSPTLDLTGPMSITAWLLPENLNGNRAIVEKDLALQGYNIHISDGAFGFRINRVGITAGTILAGQWTHLAAVYTGSNICQFINGQLINTSPSGRLTLGSKDLSLGCWWHPQEGPSRLFQGTMDEIRIYSRALSTAEVTALYSLRGDATASPAASPSSKDRELVRRLESEWKPQNTSNSDLKATMPPPSTSGKNLIVNGSFEVPRYARGRFGAPRDLAPWHTEEACFEIWGAGHHGCYAADGDQCLEILANATANTVSQTVNTVPGRGYTVSFFHSPRPSCTSFLKVAINSQIIATFVEDGTRLTTHNWRRFQTNFTATATTATLSFTDKSTGASGTHVDGVVLQQR